jgi:hypothetical protein
VRGRLLVFPCRGRTLAAESGTPARCLLSPPARFSQDF